MYLTDAWDGGMIVLAMFMLNLFHPGILLKEDVQPEDNLFMMGAVDISKDSQFTTTTLGPAWGSSVGKFKAYRP